MSDRPTAPQAETTSSAPSWPNVAELDEAYRRHPFPRFARWSASIPADEARRADELRQEIDAAASERGAAALDQALRVALRAAAVDTGAIEGLYATDEGITMTIARRAAGWEALAQAQEILPFFEAQLAALEIVMDLVTETKPLARGGVTELALKELHREITRAQATYEVQTPAGAQRQSLPRGEYKTMPNHVQGADGSFFSYAPVADTPGEVRRLVEELSSEAFSEAHPLVQFAYAHYGLVRIHPFADGNGRLARALASLYLLRAFRVPLVVFAEDRARYLETLRAADGGEHAVFTEFVGWTVVGALELVLDEMTAAGGGAIEEQAERFNRLVEEEGDLDADRADRAAHLLRDAAETALRAAVSEAKGRFASIRFRVGGAQGAGSRKGFRAPRDDEPNGVLLHAAVDRPVKLDHNASILALVPSDAASAKLVLAGVEDFEVEASRLLPRIDPRVERRLRRWAGRQLSRFIEQLEEKIRHRIHG